jgi:aconitate hydratase
MGVLPLEFKGAGREALGLDGTETFDVAGLGEGLTTRAELQLRVHRASGEVEEIPVLCRIDTDEELMYYRHGGILPYVYRELVAQI